MTKSQVIFGVGRGNYSFDSLNVRAVERETDVRSLPGAPECIIGLALLRGELVPVCDLNKKFNTGNEDLDVSQDGEVWESNPAPKETAAMVQKCLSDKKMLYVILKSADAMITINSDDTYMTVYHPSEDLVELLGSLTASEGLFLWKPASL